MPSKEELEIENAELRAQLAAIDPVRPAHRNCNDSCPHGVPYHGGPICPGEIYENYATACACPVHPDDPAIPDKWVT